MRLSTIAGLLAAVLIPVVSAHPRSDLDEYVFCAHLGFSECVDDPGRGQSYLVCEHHHWEEYKCPRRQWCYPLGQVGSGHIKCKADPI
jgi:hypothetical protein